MGCKKFRKKLLATGLALLMLAAVSMPVSAMSFKSYTYSVTADTVEIPAPYAPVRQVRMDRMGTTALSEPSQIVTDGEQVYIADTGNNRVVVTDAAFQPVLILNTFLWQGEELSLTQPRGVFATQRGTILVADTGAARLVEFDRKGNCLRLIGKPVINVLGADYNYQPIRVVEDVAGRLYVIASGINRGVIQLSMDGEFSSFFGSPRVEYNPLDLIWRRLVSREQRDKFEKFVPTEYNSLFIDERGFLHLTAVSETEKMSVESVTLLNYSGNNIINYPPFYGDFTFNSGAASSVFVDITVDAAGNYYCLDQTRGRVFAYTEEGDLLYAFGGLGNQLGAFTSPASLTMLGSNLLILDRSTGMITEYRRTDFGSAVHSAIALYRNGEYEASVEGWNTVLEYARDYPLANIGIGKALYREKDYAAALDYLRMAGEMEYGSIAFSAQRNAVLETLIPYIFITLGILVVLAVLFIVLRRKYPRREKKRPAPKLVRDLRYVFHVMVRPFDGFWDLKHEKRGSWAVVWILIGLMIVNRILSAQFTGYFFRPAGETPNVNLPLEVANAVLLLGLWTISNWCLTTLMDGEGSLKDVFMATTYAMAPLILLGIPLTFVSNILSLGEAPFYEIVNTIAMLWCAFLIYCSSLVTHQYTALKNTLVCVSTVVGIGIILFIGLLFYSLIVQFLGFAVDMYSELIFRL